MNGCDRFVSAPTPPAGAQFAPWDGPATLMVSPPAHCVRGPPRGRNSRLGTARRRSWLLRRLRKRGCFLHLAPLGKSLRQAIEGEIDDGGREQRERLRE